MRFDQWLSMMHRNPDDLWTLDNLRRLYHLGLREVDRDHNGARGTFLVAHTRQPSPDTDRKRGLVPQRNPEWYSPEPNFDTWKAKGNFSKKDWERLIKWTEVFDHLAREVDNLYEEGDYDRAEYMDARLEELSEFMDDWIEEQLEGEIEP